MFRNRRQAILSGLALILLALIAFYAAKVAAPETSHYIFAMTFLIFSLPTYWAVKMWLGWRNGIILIAGLAIFTLLMQNAANLGGMTFRDFDSSDQFGFRIFGPMYLMAVVAWPPLIFASYAVSSNLSLNRIPRTFLTALLVTASSALLDWVALEHLLWRDLVGEIHYGHVFSHIVGWVLVGLGVSVIFEGEVFRVKPLLSTPVQLTAGAIFIIFFWTLLAGFDLLIVPVAACAVLFFGLIVFYRKYYYAFDEMIVLVDEDNNAIGTVRKSEVHDNDTKLHRAFSVFLFNSKGELLLQQRAFSKKTWPGVWSNSCCGHTMLHESSEAAGIRRVGYELGLKNTKLTMALPDFRYRAEKDGVVENEICPVLIGFTDEMPKPNPDEVANIKWVDWEEFLLSLKDPETEISPWAIEEVELLAESEIFKNLYYKNSSNSVD